MPFLLIGLLALILCVHGLRELGRAPPQKINDLRRQIAGLVGRGAGVLTLVAAALLSLRGEWPVGLALAGFGFYLLTGRKFSLADLDVFARPGAGGRKSSTLRTKTLEMTLDHASGAVDGLVLNGPFSGRRLNELSRAELAALRQSCAALDPETLMVLDPYLDRRFAGGAATGERDFDPRRDDAGGRRSGEMSEEQAYQALGVEPGASAEEIIRAHRRLMKERHPDHGGSTDEAARLNQAKDKLLRRHG